jgi:hypothetical protein
MKKEFGHMPLSLSPLKGVRRLDTKVKLSQTRADSTKRNVAFSRPKRFDSAGISSEYFVTPMLIHKYPNR